MTTIPEPLQRNREARACYIRVRRLLSQRGQWDELVAFGFGLIAEECARYLYAARSLAQQQYEPALQKEIDEGLEAQRQVVREALVAFGILDSEIPGYASPNERGEDATIAALCASPIKETLR